MGGGFFATAFRFGREAAAPFLFAPAIFGVARFFAIPVVVFLDDLRVAAFVVVFFARGRLPEGRLPDFFTFAAFLPDLRLAICPRVSARPAAIKKTSGASAPLNTPYWHKRRLARSARQSARPYAGGMLALGKLLNHFLVEGRDVVGLSRRYQPIVDNALGVDPLSSRISQVGRERRPRCEAPALDGASVDERPWGVTNRRNRLSGIDERFHETNRRRIHPKLI